MKPPQASKNVLRARELTPHEALDALADRIAAVDPALGGYLSTDLEDARRQAENADVTLPLGGVPIAIKDVISVAGHPCGCASKILTGYIAPYDATVVARLRAAGAIPFGRANMDEFAMGSSTENSGMQLTRNPWDTDRVPGGSSGGSAAVVAAHEAFAALGTDTGGFHSPTSRIVRRRRTETQLWAGIAVRAGGFRLVARPGRADHKNRRGRRAVARDHSRGGPP